MSAGLVSLACGGGGGGDDDAVGTAADGGSPEQLTTTVSPNNPATPSDDPGGAPPGSAPGDGLPAEQELIDDAAEPVASDSECARDSYAGQRVNVNLYLLLDVSGSMLAAVSTTSDQTQWDAVRAAITGFIEADDSAGLNLALNYYPVVGDRSDCDSSGSCSNGVQCLEAVCDLRFAFADVIGSCTSNAQCNLVLELEGETFTESCVRPGRCDNAPYEMCLLDEQCPTGGTCQVSDAGLCPGETSCESANYVQPSVDLSTLPVDGANLVESLLSTEPDPFGVTPTHIALDGAYSRVGEWLQSDPNTQSFLVLATDGAPLGCAPGQDQESAETEATRMTNAVIGAARDSGIDTFVIGVQPDLSGVDGAEALEYQAYIDSLATKLDDMARLGGTEQPFMVTANDSAAASFSQALSEIRGQVLPCEYVVPAPEQGAVSFDRLNVEVSSASGSETVPKVDSAAQCVPGENAWYYNVDAATQTPTRVVLCPDTCASVNAQEGSRVDIVLGCQTVTREVR